MAQPQRGQEEQLPPQIVPQEEQVLQQPLPPLWAPPALPAEPFPAEDCCGNRGIEKNSMDLQSHP